MNCINKIKCLIFSYLPASKVINKRSAASVDPIEALRLAIKPSGGDEDVSMLILSGFVDLNTLIEC